ncbi:hypothetical protein J1N35_021970 [Gossypium stocksii]|uniref:RRM domain-containing protein n=1 Tax=Gossypium stocksii TaxID=47602 RepID=A0A9D4A304_9ROSI|nr:hypothetical protein J1N35_021970 [Gossypium stocksii]
MFDARNKNAAINRALATLFKNEAIDQALAALFEKCRYRPEDLHGPFRQFGRLKDVYLPRNYYNGQSHGFGFVQYLDPADAADAKYQMDGYVLLGRELIVVFAEENKKKPS